MATMEWDAAVLKIMQEELADRQRNPELAARDAHGHPAARQAPGSPPVPLLIPLRAAA